MGARAPGLAGRRLGKPKVRMQPFWVYWDDDGKGGVRLLATDRCHTHKMISLDEDGIPVEQPYYQSKGFVPLNMLPKEHKAHGMFKTLCEAAVARAKDEGMHVSDIAAWVPISYWPEAPAPAQGPSARRRRDAENIRI